ncbi:MAG: hypothetical protein J3Q66DRAFT_385257 [Benniella sp.]|nr:MAG: hypothetical protein J3Q66DRAFT_385257 [Benniella sp.]
MTNSIKYTICIKVNDDLTSTDAAILWDLVEQNGGKVIEHLDIDNGMLERLIVEVSPALDKTLKQRTDITFDNQTVWEY